MFSKQYMQKKIVIIGGGISGISAAIYALKNNFDVTLIEASNNLGGRLYSKYDSETHDSYDNGQHIMVGAYNVFLELLRELGSLDKLYVQDKFKVNYITKDNKFELKSVFFDNQIGFLFGLLSLKVFNFSEKINIIRLVLDIKLNKFFKNNDRFIDTLKKYKQTENVIKILWEPLCVSTLNTSIYESSTSVIANVLKQSFFADGFNSKLIIPKVGLSELLSNFEDYFIKKGGKILKNHSLKDMIISIDKIEKIILTKDKELTADFYISALSNERYNKYFPSKLELETSSIISAYLWYDIDFIKEEMISVVGYNIQWIFNKRKFGFNGGILEYKGYYSIVISDADTLLDKSNSEIEKLIVDEINEIFPVEKQLLKIKVIKEKMATIKADTKSIELKRNFKNKIKNLAIAGDWLDIELPSTIETAAKSGKNAIQSIL